MKFLKLFLLLAFIFPGLVSASDIKAYKGEITVSIVENDTAFARNSAFQSLQNLLLSAAIEDLIGPKLPFKSNC